MRILYMGTPQFAVESLQQLIKDGEEVVGVVTQPDRPQGRGKKIAPPPVKVFADAKGLPVFQPEKLKDNLVIEKLSSFCPDVIVVVAYGKILPREVLSLPPQGCINLHASLLPKYRGAAPIHWALLRGEDVTGVTTMYMDEGLDTGDIIYQQEVPISPADTAGSLYTKLAAAGGKLLVKTIVQIKKGCAPRIPQNEQEATYAPPLERKDEVIDWSRSAQELWLQVRGLNPEPGATTYWEGKNLKVWEAVPFAEVEFQEGQQDEMRGNPGQVLSVDNKAGVLVSTGAGLLQLHKVQPAGKKVMLACDFARGYRVEPGMSFGG
ncbi:MAG: methionyl-tRNA formyltransferase [bacterium]